MSVEVGLALELHQDRLVRAPDRVCQHFEAAAVGHAQDHLARPAPTARCITSSSIGTTTSTPSIEKLLLAGTLVW